MIVLDEQLADPRIVAAIARWYRGAVHVLPDLRPGTLIPDPDVPPLLRTIKQPTFVTVNYRDFWHKIAASLDYCIVCLDLPTARKKELPTLLREVLSLPQYRTKRGRMGAVISVRGRAVEEYRV